MFSYSGWRGSCPEMRGCFHIWEVRHEVPQLLSHGILGSATIPLAVPKSTWTPLAKKQQGVSTMIRGKRHSRDGHLGASTKNCRGYDRALQQQQPMNRIGERGVELVLGGVGENDNMRRRLQVRLHKKKVKRRGATVRNKQPHTATGHALQGYSGHQPL